MKKNNETEITGVCRFCYQTRIVTGGAGMTEEELTEAATRQCDCEAAKGYRTKVRRKEKAEKLVHRLFGEDAGAFMQPGETINFMLHGVDIINNSYIKNLTINMDGGLKCKIALTIDDKIKVSREAKSVVEFKE